MHPSTQNNPFSLDFASDLNPEQFKAVTSPLGPALVLAGAGSGKTRTLTYRVAFLLSQNIAPWEILLLTFTNKAATEMLERVHSLTGIPPHKFWGGTFHSIAQRILRLHSHLLGFKSSFNILDASDSENRFSHAIKLSDPSYLKSKDLPKPKVLLEIISYSRNTCSSIQETIASNYPYFSYLSEKISAFALAYKNLKLSEQVLDYDDLLESLLQLFALHPHIKESLSQKFKYVLVDEYQDTNKLQSQIIDAFASHHNVMAVGDDAQCIYSWRGADYQNILTFKDRHPNTQIFKIETNYRSSPEILNFANAILKNLPSDSAFSKSLLPTKPKSKKPLVVSVPDTRQQASFIIKRIHGLLSEGHHLGDIAILYRAHFHAMDLQMELSKQHIPYIITSGVRFFEQAHVKDLISQIRFVSNPNDSSAFYRFSAILPKVGPKTAEKILSEAQKISTKNNTPLVTAFSHPDLLKKIPEPSKDTWTNLAYTLQDIHNSIIANTSPSTTLNIAIDGWYGDYLKNLYPNWPARLDDLLSLQAFANKFDSIPELLAQLVLLNSETSEKNISLPNDSLKLSTIHQAKGLEFPVVFLIGLSDSLFPLKRALDEGNLDEERRLFYVASTRAMQELIISYPKISFQGGPPTLLNPSRFISESPPDLYDKMSYASSLY